MITSKTANVLDVRLANGNKCKMKDTKLLGYCHCQLHEGYLTAAILCEHDCIKKQCHHLEKYASHPYWAYLEWKKKEKAKHRTTMKEVRSKLINTDTEMEKLVVAAQRLADGMDYPNIIFNCCVCSVRICLLLYSIVTIKEIIVATAPNMPPKYANTSLASHFVIYPEFCIYKLLMIIGPIIAVAKNIIVIAITIQILK